MHTDVLHRPLLLKHLINVMIYRKTNCNQAKTWHFLYFSLVKVIKTRIIKDKCNLALWLTTKFCSPLHFIINPHNSTSSQRKHYESWVCVRHKKTTQKTQETKSFFEIDYFSMKNQSDFSLITGVLSIIKIILFSYSLILIRLLKKSNENQKCHAIHF